MDILKKTESSSTEDDEEDTIKVTEQNTELIKLDKKVKEPFP